MAPAVADGESSLAPISNEEETPAEAMEASVGVAAQVMEVGPVAAVEEPDEVEPEEGKEVVDPEKASDTGAEPDEEMEDPGEDPEELDIAREEAEAANDKETVMEPLSVLKAEELEELDDESEEAEDEEDDEEPSEVDEEYEEVDGEEPEETKEGAESVPDDVNEKIGNKDKDEVDDIHSNGDDSAGSRNGDIQNCELAGGLELLVDELPKNCVEGDIAMLFRDCGEIKSIRIIINSSTEKSKDVAFVCFASIEATDKALTECKKGMEVKGIKVRVSHCQDNDALFLGNICKSWTKDQVLTALNNIGIQECKLTLPSNYKGTNRGFAFLQFDLHYNTRAAFRRLIKSDAILGIDRSWTVSFYRKPTNPTDDLLEAKKVYLEHVPPSWNEDKIKECCQEYGTIVNVDIFQISKNMKSETFCFVEFSSSKNALACVEGINTAKIVDGSFKLSACLARPKNCATSEGAMTSKKQKNHTEKVCVDNNSLQKLPKVNKGKLTSRATEVVVKNNAPSKMLKDDDRKTISQDAAELQQTSKPTGERKLGKNKNACVNQRPSKKARNKCNVDESNLQYQNAAVLQTSNSFKGKRKHGKDVNGSTNERPLKKAHNIRNVRRATNRIRGAGQPAPAGPQYSRAHQSLSESSRSKAYASDLEPHAGYISPANQIHSTRTFDQRRIGQYDIHLRNVHPYSRETAPSQAIYSDYLSHTRNQSVSYYPGRGPFITRRGDY